MYDKPRTAFGPALRNVNLIMGASCGRVLESTREGCSAIYENPSLFIKGTGSCHVNAVVSTMLKRDECRLITVSTDCDSLHWSLGLKIHMRF